MSKEEKWALALCIILGIFIGLVSSRGFSIEGFLGALTVILFMGIGLVLTHYIIKKGGRLD